MSNTHYAMDLSAPPHQDSREKYLSPVPASTKLVSVYAKGDEDNAAQTKEMKIDFSASHILSQMEHNKPVAAYDVEENFDQRCDKHVPC